ncbi:hypothetical protein, partial [Pseudoduganella sp. RAF53_2]|uniref:hypothetical protein n=1 Tax=Pseudoduganella sp. RAF53_2 TaxID=3233060 RepID=UPI003F957D7B
AAVPLPKMPVKLKEKAEVAETPQVPKEDKPDTPPGGGGSVLASLSPQLKKELSETLTQEDGRNITDSPGLSALGVNVGDINHPATPKDFAMALAKGTDASGKVKEGVSLQIAPASLFFPRTLRAGEDYEASYLTQVWARTSVELATAKSEHKQIGQQLAGSLTFGIFDRADPRLYWSLPDACARDALTELGEPPMPVKLMNEDQEKQWTEKQAKYALKANNCAGEAWAAKSKELWKEPRWYAGASKAWKTGDSEKLRDLKSGPAMIWTTYSQGMEFANTSATVRKLFELSLSKKWHMPVQDSDDDSKLHDEERTDAIVRFRFSRDRWNAFVDAGLSRVRTDGVLSSNVRRFGYGAQYRVDDNLWLVLGSVVEHGYVSNDSKRTLLNMGLRFGQTDKAVFQEPGNK